MLEPTMVYECREFVVVNKPAGLIVHEARSAKREATRIKRELTLVDWLLMHYPEVAYVGDDLVTRPGIVHRLDRDTSGIMLVARSQESFLYLKSLFQRREIKKTYYALVWGHVSPREGEIRKSIGIISGSVKRSVHSRTMTKEAVTTYHAERFFSNNESLATLLRVEPLTGRTHQIRVHLAYIGNPIVGDPLYGKKRKSISASRLMLHAYSLEFRERNGSMIVVEAELPDDFAQVLDSFKDD